MNGETIAVPRGELGLYKLHQVATEGTLLTDFSCSEIVLLVSFI